MSWKPVFAGHFSAPVSFSVQPRRITHIRHLRRTTKRDYRLLDGDVLYGLVPLVAQACVLYSAASCHLWDDLPLNFLTLRL